MKNNVYNDNIRRLYSKKKKKKLHQYIIYLFIYLFII